MENTCKQKDCFLWKKYGEHCPNYVRTSWKNEENMQQKTVHDCAPIRTMLMISDLYSRLIGSQQVVEGTRNEVIKLVTLANAVQKGRLIDG